MDELITRLSTTDYISGEKLCAALGMTRGAVWKRVEKLRREGYDVRSAGKRGYALFLKPDSLLPGYVQKSLRTRRMGRGEIYYQETVGSTNAWCKEKAAQGAPDGALFLCDRQMAGRGRLGRAWVSETGESLTASLLLRPRLTPENAQALTLAAAVSVCEAVEGLTGLAPAIKWPNDVLIGGKKVCGILLELSADMDSLQSVAMGIGINVRQRAFPGELADTATSLFLEAGRDFDRRELLCAMLLALEKNVARAEESGYRGVATEYEKRSATLGREVIIKPVSGEAPYPARALALDDTGALLIDVSGERRRVVSAEVSVRGGI